MSTPLAPVATAFRGDPRGLRGARRFKLLPALLPAIFALLASLAAAVPAGGQGKRIAFRHISTADGLPHDSITVILQDHHGFMWLGTEDGLSRYDGVRFVNFRTRRSDPGSLSNNWIWSLAEDREGRLWIGTDGGGLNLWQPVSRSFVRFTNNPADPRSLSHDNVRAIFEDSSGNVWVGTEKGLNVLHPESGTFTRYTHNPSDPHSLSHDDIRRIHEDGAGRLWIGTKGGGLNLFNRDTQAFRHFVHDPEDPTTLSGDSVQALLSDADGSLWVGTFAGGLNRLDPETGACERFLHDPQASHSLSDNLVRAILRDANGVLWVATEDGLNEWLPEGRHFVRYGVKVGDPSSLLSDNVRALYRDRGGVMWVGTAGGAGRWNSATGSFARYHVDPQHPSRSLLDNSVWGVADSAEFIWVATYSALTRIDRASGRAVHFTADPNDPGSLVEDRVVTVYVDSLGVLWVGTRSGGLHRLNPDGKTFTRFRHDPADPGSISSDRVARILEDSHGILWVGTHGGGLNRFDRSTETFIAFRADADSSTSLSSDRVLALAEDSSGVLWLGTDEGGLNRFDRRTGTFTHYRSDPDDARSLSNDTVFSIHEDAEGTLWVGTQGGGLNRWALPDREAHRVSFEIYREEDGLSNDVVYGILEDDDGFLWLSTNDGLSKFDPVNETFKKFDDTHGLQSREFNFGAYHRSADGEMFFGSNKGFNSFLPSSISTNHHEPNVVLTSVRKLNREISTETPLTDLRSLELQHTDNVVSFEFAALDFTSPEENRYAYKLDGFDEDWTRLGNLNRATYTNLDPGNYVFRVRGSNNDGVWGTKELQLGVRVIPPWWKTSWAYSLYLLAVAAAAAQYLRRQISMRRLLKDQVRARTSELAERNEELEDAIHQLELASVTDSLTGLRNRRFLVNTIERDLALVRRLRRDRQENVTLGAHDRTPTDSLFLAFDLDGFKDVNDSFGHSAGDRVLLQVRQLLEEACRESDTLVRWGGDEFVVIARHMDRDSAESLAERLRRSVERHPFDLGIGRTASLTCSIGFAFYPFLSSNPDLFNWEQVMTIADRALYVAKKSGRNAWVGVYETPKTDLITPRNLMRLINERIEDLVGEGNLELRTSIDDHDHLVWAWA